jgi:hypothetical protein
VVVEFEDDTAGGCFGDDGVEIERELSVVARDA